MRHWSACGSSIRTLKLNGLAIGSPGILRRWPRLSHTAERGFDPAPFRQAAKPITRSVQTTPGCVVAWVDVAWVDVAPVHADRRRAREADAGGGRGIRGVDVADRGSRSDLGDDLLEHRPGRRVVRAVREPEELDGLAHGRSSVASTRHEVRRAALSMTIDSPRRTISRIRSSMRV